MATTSSAATLNVGCSSQTPPAASRPPRRNSPPLRDRSFGFVRSMRDSVPRGRDATEALLAVAAPDRPMPDVAAEVNPLEVDLVQRVVHLRPRIGDRVRHRGD